MSKFLHVLLLNTLLYIFLYIFFFFFSIFIFPYTCTKLYTTINHLTLKGHLQDLLMVQIALKINIFTKKDCEIPVVAKVKYQKYI